MGTSPFDERIQHAARQVQEEVRRSGGRRRKRVDLLLHKFGRRKLTAGAIDEVTSSLRQLGINLDPPLLELYRGDTVTLALTLEAAESAPDVATDTSPFPVALPELTPPTEDLFDLLFDFARADDLTLFRTALGSDKPMCLLLVPQRGRRITAYQAVIKLLASQRLSQQALQRPDRVEPLSSGHVASLRADSGTLSTSIESSLLHIAPEVVGAMVTSQDIKEASARDELMSFLRDVACETDLSGGYPWLVMLSCPSIEELRGYQAIDRLLDEIRCIIPHTYRLVDAFDPSDANAADAVLADVLRFLAWVYGFPQVPIPDRDEVHSIDSFQSDLQRWQDHSLAHLVESEWWSRVKFSGESSEHIALKVLAAEAISRSVPCQPGDIVFEQREVIKNGWEHTGNAAFDETKKADVVLKDRIWVEAETFRGRAQPSWSVPELLQATVRRLTDKFPKSGYSELWLVVPSVELMLFRELIASGLTAIGRNLETCAEVSLLCPDLQNRSLVKVQLARPLPRPLELRPTPPVEQPGTLVDSSEKEFSWECVGGLEELIEELKQTIVNPIKYRTDSKFQELEMMYPVGAVSGVLLYGLPGCGKTLIARTLARECGFNYIEVKPSDVLDRWVGWGVQNLRTMFEKAKRMQPCLLLLDELDAYAHRRVEGNMHVDQMQEVNEILVHLDIVAGAGVVVVATTNRLSAIDPAIRRSGRFDLRRAVFPPNARERKAIFEVYLEKRRMRPREDERESQEGLPLADDIDYEELAAATPLFASSDIKLCVDNVTRNAKARAVQEWTPQRCASRLVRITQADLMQAVADMKQTNGTSLQRDDIIRWIREYRSEVQVAGPRFDDLCREFKEVFGAEP